MRLSLAIAFLTVSTTGAFAPAWGVTRSQVRSFLSTVEADAEVAAKESQQSAAAAAAAAAPSGPLTGAEINARLEAQLEKLREKDATSPLLSKAEINVIHEDDHIVVVEKPSGVLSVCPAHNDMAQAVYDSFGDANKLDSPDKMVVHRLGMDTSGIMVFCKTPEAVRGMNAAFRARKVERTYEALVCGHMEQDSGMISLPLMRDYEFPPFMRVSTDEHQRALLGLSAAEVGKKLLALPKDSLTKYEVVAREELDGQPATRVALTSVSGRTHQLNVHMAAFGHAIVGDSTYGVGGAAAPNGGLTAQEQDELVPNSSRAGLETQQALSKAKPCVHAKSLKFRHPVTGKDISLSADAPF